MSGALWRRWENYYRS